MAMSKGDARLAFIQTVMGIDEVSCRAGLFKAEKKLWITLILKQVSFLLSN